MRFHLRMVKYVRDLIGLIHCHLCRHLVKGSHDDLVYPKYTTGLVKKIPTGQLTIMQCGYYHGTTVLYL